MICWRGEVRQLWGLTLFLWLQRSFWCPMLAAMGGVICARTEEKHDC
jgi:hypothetical protein